MSMAGPETWMTLPTTCVSVVVAINTSLFQCGARTPACRVGTRADARERNVYHPAKNQVTFRPRADRVESQASARVPTRDAGVRAPRQPHCHSITPSSIQRGRSAHNFDDLSRD